MAEFFAAADVGSNALRFQLAEVEEPGMYRIIEQDREIAEKSGRAPLAIKSIVRAGAKKKK